MTMNLPKPRLVTKEYRTLTQIKGPLIFIERTSDIASVSYTHLTLPTNREV